MSDHMTLIPKTEKKIHITMTRETTPDKSPGLDSLGHVDLEVPKPSKNHKLRMMGGTTNNLYGGK